MVMATQEVVADAATVAADVGASAACRGWRRTPTAEAELGRARGPLAARGRRPGQPAQAPCPRTGPRAGQTRTGQGGRRLAAGRWTTSNGRSRTPTPTRTRSSTACRRSATRRAGARALGYPRDDERRAVRPGAARGGRCRRRPGRPHRDRGEVLRPGYGRRPTQLRPAAVVVSATRGVRRVAARLLRGARGVAGPRPPTRSSARTARWPAATTRTSTRTRAPRTGSRRSTRPTTCCPIPRPARATTGSGADFRQVPEDVRRAARRGRRPRRHGRSGTGSAAARAVGGVPVGGIDIEDLFGGMFGGRVGGSRARSPAPTRKRSWS